MALITRSRNGHSAHPCTRMDLEAILRKTPSRPAPPSSPASPHRLGGLPAATAPPGSNTSLLSGRGFRTQPHPRFWTGPPSKLSLGSAAAKPSTSRAAARPARRAFLVPRASVPLFLAARQADEEPPEIEARKRHVADFLGPARQSLSPPRIPLPLAMNPDTFSGHTDEEILSTLAHEMAHVWQQAHGTPPRRSYHDRQWAGKMKEIGLQPTTTGEPGGKETGQSVTHTIVPGGPYAKAYAKLKARGFQLHWPNRERTRSRDPFPWYLTAYKVPR